MSSLMSTATAEMGPEVEAVALNLAEVSKISPTASSFFLGKKHKRSSVTYLIHKNLTQAAVEIEAEIGGSLKAVTTTNKNKTSDFDENDCDSLFNEIERLDSSEETLHQDLDAAEEEWKQQRQSSFLERVALFPSLDTDDDDDERDEIESESPINENDDEEAFAQHTRMARESDAVQLEALSATGLGLSLGMAADALASRMYRDVADSTRILPSYLQRQLMTATSMWDPVRRSEDELSVTSTTEAPDNDAMEGTVGRPSLWTVGVPLLGSVSATGNMMLFMNKLMAVTEELD